MTSEEDVAGCVKRCEAVFYFFWDPSWNPSKGSLWFILFRLIMASGVGRCPSTLSKTFTFLKALWTRDQSVSGHFYLQLLWFVNALPLRGIWPKRCSEQQTALVALYHCLFVILFSIFRSVRKHALPSLMKVWSCTWIILSCALIILAEMNMMSGRICPLRRLQKNVQIPASEQHQKRGSKWIQFDRWIETFSIPNSRMWIFLDPFRPPISSPLRRP